MKNRERRPRKPDTIVGNEAEGLRRADSGRESVDAAAPPDDGGGRGSFTRPQDASTPDDPHDGDAQSPDLHWSPDTGAQERERDA